MEGSRLPPAASTPASHGDHNTARTTAEPSYKTGCFPNTVHAHSYYVCTRSHTRSVVFLRTIVCKCMMVTPTDRCPFPQTATPHSHISNFLRANHCGFPLRHPPPSTAQPRLILALSRQHPMRASYRHATLKSHNEGGTGSTL